MAEHHGRTMEEFKEEMLQDPEFRAEWEAAAPRYALADALVDLRLDAGLTQEQLAERLGTKREYVARIENKPANLTLKTLVRLAAATGTDITLRFEGGPKGGIEVKLPATTMVKNGALEKFE